MFVVDRDLQKPLGTFSFSQGLKQASRRRVSPLWCLGKDLILRWSLLCKWAPTVLWHLQAKSEAAQAWNRLLWGSSRTTGFLTVDVINCSIHYADWPGFPSLCWAQDHTCGQWEIGLEPRYKDLLRHPAELEDLTLHSVSAFMTSDRWLNLSELRFLKWARIHKEDNNA